jgi:hypothetical protein
LISSSYMETPPDTVEQRYLSTLSYPVPVLYHIPSVLIYS